MFPLEQSHFTLKVGLQILRRSCHDSLDTHESSHLSS